mmetsp:Transcript_28175/g.79570  ORF Transcript_28175/g.79570 Transcript_28175/m.79570 type:complete len:146 (+) Transcript_28175:246-683(+)
MASLLRRSRGLFFLGVRYGSTSGRLVDSAPTATVDDIFHCALQKQTGVTLKYMMDFGSVPMERQLLISAQFLHKELPVRLAHRVVELENLPYGLSGKSQIRKVGALSYCLARMQIEEGREAGTERFRYFGQTDRHHRPSKIQGAW